MPTKTTSSPSAQPPRHHINVLGQLLKYIPQGMVQAAAREHGVDTQARTYSVWSHLAAMVIVQLAHAFSLNDVCDWLRLKCLEVTPPARRRHNYGKEFHVVGILRLETGRGERGACRGLLAGGAGSTC